MTKKTEKPEKKTNLRELKTGKTQRKEDMLSYLDFLRLAAEEDRMSSAIFVTDMDDMLDFQAIGEVNEMEVIGLLEVAKTYFQMELF